jgi:hypothetical protein
MRPYLGGGRISGQHLVVRLNGKAIQSLTVSEPNFATYRIIVPVKILLSENRLRFDLPDAASPMKEENTGDRRQLSLLVRSLRWLPAGR